MPRNNRSQRLSRLREMAASDVPEDGLTAARLLLKEYPGRRPQSLAKSVLRRLATGEDVAVAEAARKLLDRSLRRAEGGRKAPDTAKGPQEVVEETHRDLPKHPDEPDWHALGLPDPRSAAGSIDLAEVRAGIRESGFGDLWWYLRQAARGGLGGLAALVEVDEDSAVRIPDGEEES